MDDYCTFAVSLPRSPHSSTELLFRVVFAGPEVQTRKTPDSEVSEVEELMQEWCHSHESNV